MIILSKLADYGVIVAAELAADPGRQVTAGQLAASTRLPQATVAKVLKALAHAGIVTGARGAAGGYRLAKGAEAISVASVVAAIDGAIGITQCTTHPVSGATHTCERTHFCPTRPHWQRINLAVSTALSAVTLADMVADRLPFLARPARPSGDRAAP
ncbi:MAG TPA: SUF system Fe-S cluster assembly regulator [Stellaceae bacterium]|nr:SUF system Fe-S cluster assembly regulator [Stellaceae bacterium]